MRLQFYGEVFEFKLERSDELGLQGFLQLDSEKREKLAQLCKAEEELEDQSGPWYLDQNGERLSSEDLFVKSPWSVYGRNGPMKLLCRFQDFQTGELHFQTQYGYPGEIFDWVRQKNA
jgi:hypothetical protein